MDKLRYKLRNTFLLFILCFVVINSFFMYFYSSTNVSNYIICCTIKNEKEYSKTHKDFIGQLDQIDEKYYALYSNEIFESRTDLNIEHIYAKSWVSQDKIKALDEIHLI